MLAAEANIPQLGLTSIQTTTTVPESVLSDDLAAAFNDDNDDFFADIPINSIQHSNQNSINQRSFAINVNIHPNECLNDSLSAVFQDDNDFGDDYVWGSTAKNTRVSATPNVEPSVRRTKNGNSETQYNYAWGSSETSEILCDEANIKCSGCHMTAKKCVNTTIYIFGPCILYLNISDYLLRRKGRIRVASFMYVQKVIPVHSSNGPMKLPLINME